jgi:hypothetical protein
MNCYSSFDFFQVFTNVDTTLSSQAIKKLSVEDPTNEDRQLFSPAAH